MPKPRVQELKTVGVVSDPGDLDREGYLRANPDVRAALLDPADHFARYGHRERRQQFWNTAAIKRLRQRKLRRIAFRHPAESGADEQGRLDYLPQAVRDSFEIPDTPPAAANDYNDELVDLIRGHPGELFLDVGAGLRHTYYSNVVNTEVWPSASTDVVCVGEDLPFSDSQFDHVFCLAVLEHTKRPWRAVDEIIRVTRPGGLIRIDWPFLQPVHGYPHHFYNATPKGNRSLFEERCDIVACDVRVWQHPIFALTWMLNEWRDGLPEADRAAFYDLRLGDLIGDIPHRSYLVTQPFCTRLSREAQETIAAGTTLIARKRPAA